MFNIIHIFKSAIISRWLQNSITKSIYLFTYNLGVFYILWTCTMTVHIMPWQFSRKGFSMTKLKPKSIYVLTNLSISWVNKYMPITNIWPEVWCWIKDLGKSAKIWELLLIVRLQIDMLRYWDKDMFNFWAALLTSIVWFAKESIVVCRNP